MIRVVLIDDEEHALDMLEIMLLELGNVDIVGKYMNPLQAVQDIKQLQVDAVFMDIEMPVMKGVDAARAIQTVHPGVHIIFTTAYAEYAIEAFEIHSLDYLLKPIKLERLHHSFKRIEEAVTGSNGEHEVNDDPRICCMGGFTVQSGKAESTQLSWRTNKEKELCAFLVHRSGRAVERAVITEALWPESDAEKARSYLHTCISLLRKNIRESGLPIAVQKTGNGYMLDCGSLICDVLELEQLLDKPLEETGLGLQRLERIVALYKGDYMEDCGFNWVYPRREKLLDKYIHSLRKLFLFFKKKGQLTNAKECLGRIVAISPDSEQDSRELMKLHMEMGDRKEAIKVYRQLELEVRERLDVELELETVGLYQQLISSNFRIRSGQ
ncbi:response regulator [Paenibacillus radicis (ex Xue et al. 2023)]|uniref:Response regulator n=1 Tax=Paenibacillus radicis (ex Xue et al. 2023) TaxID=2972489 RepID=A0ABT1YTG6_9BACL|nr:response regulator [Paenibacillus radicis (ex Xue et al. 2023)]MCR8636474.1 response regulator [Paenibacillus radicis (ex Xue et al. 2023)]